MTHSDLKASTAEQGLYLAIDIGTHAVKAASLDMLGTLHSLHSFDIALQREGEHYVEQDPKEILLALKRAVRKVLEDTTVPIVSCGVAIQRSTVVAWDRSTGVALSRALSWQDTRGAEFIESIKDQEGFIASRSGLVLSPHYGASKLRWLQQRYHGEHVCLSPLVSYLLFHLLEDSDALCDESNASRTQLWNLHQRQWDESLCELFEVDSETLPRVKPVLANYGLLSRSLTQGRDIQITAVVGDQNAALTGVLPDASQSLLVNIGSGAFVLGYQIEGADLHGLLHSLAYSDESSVCRIVEGTVNGAGLALSWFAQSEELVRLGGESWLLAKLHQWLEQDIDQAWFYNSIGGVGSPFWSIGRSAYFEPEDATLPSRAVAIVESIVFLLVININIMRRSSSSIDSIYVSGGLSRFNGLCERLASLTECTVIRRSGYETTLLGAARLASNFKISRDNSEASIFESTKNLFLKRRFDRFYSMMKDHKIVAHRGYASAFPENSVKAISEAIQCGADAVEFDIQFTKDDIPVVFHDYPLLRLTGLDNDIGDLTFIELSECSVHEPERFSGEFFPTRIPSLNEVVSLLSEHPNVQVFPEIKDEAFLARTRSEALALIWAELAPIAQQCTIISYDLPVLRLVQEQSLCKVGWVLSDYSETARRQISENPVHVLICNQRRFPPKSEPLWSGPWEWFAYEIVDREMMADCIERGVTWIESHDPLSLI